MTIEIVQEFLGWCSIINMALLLWWLLIITLAHNWVYQMHATWFKLSVDRFDSIHYQGMVYFKICIFFFNIVPYLALQIMG